MKVQEERERAREERALLREQRRAEVELAAERERLDKERAHYISALESLRAKGDNAAVTGFWTQSPRRPPGSPPTEMLLLPSSRVRASRCYDGRDVGSQNLTIPSLVSARRPPLASITRRDATFEASQVSSAGSMPSPFAIGRPIPRITVA